MQITRHKKVAKKAQGRIDLGINHCSSAQFAGLGSFCDMVLFCSPASVAQLDAHSTGDQEGCGFDSRRVQHTFV